jgi:sulfoquinovose isomerase
MTYAFALASMLGRPGAGTLADHGVASLRDGFRDAADGGWYASVDDQGAVVPDKRAYEHAFVVLAGSSAAAAGRDHGAALLHEALGVVERHFWREDDGLCVESWDRSWSSLEPYRGANANMHMTEAFLAAADVLGEPLWRERALRIAEGIVEGFARAAAWRLPEHFDEGWHVMPEYNADAVGDPFRPYGATVGHWLEWARLLVHLHVAQPQPPPWLLEDARLLFDAAVREGWSVDGREGFVYTVDWDGRPVVRDRLHWVVTEAIGAAAVLHRLTAEPGYEAWYRRWWDHAATSFVDRAGGSWHHQLDPDNHPASSLWSGKPDVYHALQATLVPRFPLGGSLVGAVLRAPAAG